MSLKRILILFSILALAALACNLGGGGDPTPVPPGESFAPGDTGDTGDSGDTGDTGDSSDTGNNGDSGDSGDAGDSGSSSSGSSGGGAAAAPDPLDLDDPALYAQPDTLSSYRTAMDYIFEAPGPVTGTVLMDGATRVEPFETTLEFNMYGNAVFGTGDIYTFTQIMDTQYIVLPGMGCESGFPGLQGSAFDVTLDTGGTLTGMAEYIGEETVNGVPTYAYNLTMENIDPLDPAGQDFESLENGKLYIAQDTLTVVRGILDGTGASEVLSQDPDLVGDIYYEINFFDFDQPVDIEIPAGCLAANGEDGVDTDIPLPDSATNFIQISDDVLTFTTSESIDDMIAFYEGAMPDLNCDTPTVGGGSDIGTATMSFPGCDGGQIDIIMGVTDSGDTQVNILRMP